MKITYSKKFIKQLKKAPKKIKIVFKERIKIFLKNKYDLILNNHNLHGQIKKYKSINITGDWRAVFEEKNNKIYFVLLGTHSQLYR